MKHLIKGLNLLAAITALIAMPQTGVAQGSAAPAKVSHSGVVWMDSLDPVPGSSSTMIRSRDGISASMTSSGLEPESVYTLWWVVFNNPQFCATTPCGPDDLFTPQVNAGLFGGSGQVSDAYGRVHLQAHVPAGDDTGLDFAFEFAGLFTAGLENPFMAEVHLVNRTHGPAVALTAEELEAALNSYAGGCLEFGVGPAECVDSQAAVHLP